MFRSFKTTARSNTAWPDSTAGLASTYSRNW
jgi:hypothetical protein